MQVKKTQQFARFFLKDKKYKNVKFNDKTSILEENLTSQQLFQQRHQFRA